MTKKREHIGLEKRSPSATCGNYAEDFIEDLHLPALPDAIPERLEDALRARVEALLYHLRSAKKEGYIPVLEVRLVREAQRAVLTAYELGLHDREVLYATFRRLVLDLGYVPADVGFCKDRSREIFSDPSNT
jgi:hypothetical protein